MEFIETTLKDVKLIKPKVFGDDRGFFLESWRQDMFDKELNNGKPLIFKQDNHSASAKNILRGLHLQHPHPQGKLVRVISGKVYDAIVDLRIDSPTFGQWEGFYLSANDKNLLWVPPGFAHGFYTLEDDTEFLYKCTEYYHPETEHSIRWDDVELAIDWPLIADEPMVSKKDAKGVSFQDSPKFEKATLCESY